MLCAHFLPTVGGSSPALRGYSPGEQPLTRLGSAPLRSLVCVLVCVVLGKGTQRPFHSNWQVLIRTFNYEVTRWACWYTYVSKLRFPLLSPPLFFEAVFLTEPGTYCDCQQDLGIHLSPYPPHHGFRSLPSCIAFYVGAGNLNLNPYVQQAFYPLSHLPSP